ncbi:MAG TPA: protein kinase [Pyrinomonadaceae bacterium]
MLGKKIAHYEITAKIGSGGMGEIYRARDLKLQREVAIKILPSAMSPASGERERLKHEARTLAALNHPNIVTVYSVEEDNGVDFVTMELLEGEPLDKVMTHGFLTEERFTNLARQLLEAMQAAHKEGVVHRDLKPANIIITADQRIKVLDFGIAKVFPLASTKSSSVETEDSTRFLTQPGMILGTISYFSPEQAQGQRVDHRSDIFSLGIVLYQMCSGRHPFIGDSAVSVVTSILRDAPAPFENSDAWLTRVRPVIERCLEKNPDQRYQQVSEIIDDLNAVCSGASSASTNAATDLIQAGRAALRQHSWSQALDQLQRADALVELAPDDLESLADAAWWNGKMDDCCDLMKRAYAGYLQDNQTRRAGMIAVKLADVFHHRASRSHSAGWLKRAEKLLEKAEDSVEYGYLLRFKTVVALEIHGDTESALRLAKQTFDIGNRTADKDLVAYGTQDQGRVLVDRGELADGMALLDEAMTSALSGELNPLTVAKTYCNIISACERTADYRRASEWTEEARHWCGPQDGSPFPGICSVHRAEIMRLRGSLQEAEHEAEQVAADSRGYIDVAGAAYYEIGEIKLRTGDYAGAEAAFREAHQRGHNPVPGLPLLFLGQGKIDSAKSLIARALAGTQLPLDRARLLPTHVRIALAAADLETAARSIQELESIASHFGSAALKAAAAQAQGSLDLANSDFENGSINLKRALDLWLEVGLPYEAAVTRIQLAQTYRELGDTTSADLEVAAARSTFEKLGAVQNVV